MTSSTTAASRRRRGFTLTEVMVAAGIGAFVLTAVLAANQQIVKSGLRAANYAEMETQCRRSLDQLGSDLRSATAFTYNNASDITITLPTTGQITWAWDSTTLCLYRVPGASSSATSGRLTFARGIPVGANNAAGLTFSRFDRDGNAAATDGVTKRVSVKFSVKRATTGLATATENAVTATFVLRNL